VIRRWHAADQTVKSKFVILSLTTSPTTVCPVKRSVATLRRGRGEWRHFALVESIWLPPVKLSKIATCWKPGWKSQPVISMTLAPLTSLGLVHPLPIYSRPGQRRNQAQPRAALARWEQVEGPLRYYKSIDSWGSFDSGKRFASEAFPAFRM